jgi:hypothetical protein
MFLGLMPDASKAADCKVRYQHHYKPVKSGQLIDPYHRRMLKNAYVPIAYAVAMKGTQGRTLEARLPGQKSLSACKKLMRGCFKAKISSDLKDYRYCLQTDGNGKVAKTHRIK